MSPPPAPRDVRMRGFQDRTEVADAVRLLASRLCPLPSETVDLHHAAGRVLAADIASDVAVPPFDRAAMDGYAVKAAETYAAGPYNVLELRVVGEAMPARPFPRTLESGQA